MAKGQVYTDEQKAAAKRKRAENGVANKAAQAKWRKNINNPDVVTRNGDKSSETVSMRTCRIALLTPIAEVFIMASRSTRGATTRNLIANLALRS